MKITGSNPRLRLSSMIGYDLEKSLL